MYAMVYVYIPSDKEEVAHQVCALSESLTCATNWSGGTSACRTV